MPPEDQPKRRAMLIPVTREEGEQTPFAGIPSSHPSPVQGSDARDGSDLPPFLQRLLEKHPPRLEGPDTPSESESESGRDGLETAPTLASTACSTVRLSPASVERGVDVYIAEKRASLAADHLPVPYEAATRWWDARENPKVMKGVTDNQVRLENRLQKLKAGIISGAHRDLASVHENCQNLDPTIKDLFLDEAHLALMKRSTPPAEESEGQANTVDSETEEEDSRFGSESEVQETSTTAEQHAPAEVIEISSDEEPVLPRPESLTEQGPKDLSKIAINANHPDILLDPEFGKVVQFHQLQGIGLMFREDFENPEQNGFLLAHSMGLGKTFQIIALLHAVATAAVSPDPEVRAQIGPEFKNMRALILCPGSLVPNWVSEFGKWVPSENNLGNVSCLSSATSSNPARFIAIQHWAENGGVLIIGYQLLLSIIKNRSRIPFNKTKFAQVEAWLLGTPDVVVADEAHGTINPETQISQLVSRFRTKKRIALTGSPLANSLTEYYHMIKWIDDQLLEKLDSFNANFVKPIEAGSDFQSSETQKQTALVKLTALSKLVEHKVHRLDSSVLKDGLPPLHEYHIMVTLTTVQREAYDIFVQAVRDGTAEGVKYQLWSWLATLQLCCNHPSIFQKSLKEKAEKARKSRQPADSGESKSLLQKINELFKKYPDIESMQHSHRVLILIAIIDQVDISGDKVLVFSHSLPTLKYLGELLKKLGYPFHTLTGETSATERHEDIAKFNSDPKCLVCLMSTRAGALGLNVQGANRVVIFDFSFNPSWEEQAIGRAYRMGQDKPVYIYRLISAGTFEQKLHNQCLFKKNLATRVVDQQQTSRAGSKIADPYLANCQVVEATLAKYLSVDRIPTAVAEDLKDDKTVLIRLLQRGYGHLYSEIRAFRREQKKEELTPAEEDLVEEEKSLFRDRKNAQR